MNGSFNLCDNIEKLYLVIIIVQNLAVTITVSYLEFG